MLSTTNGILPTIDLNGNSNDGWGGNGAWWVVLLVFALFGGWGNGFGGFGGNGVNSTLNTDYLAQGLRDVQSNLASNFLTLNNEILGGVCDVQGAIASNGASITSAITNGFNTQNLANLQNTNAIQRDIFDGTVGAMQNTYALQTTLSQMSASDRADTCALQTASANNTRDIVDAINDGNREILQAMAQNKVEAMQDKINELQSDLQTARFLASQKNQTNEIILGQQEVVSRLNPTPIPAIPVSAPYPYYGYGYNGFGGTTVA